MLAVLREVCAAHGVEFCGSDMLFGERCGAFLHGKYTGATRSSLPARASSIVQHNGKAYDRQGRLITFKGGFSKPARR